MDAWGKEEDFGGEASSLPPLSSSTACSTLEQLQWRSERAMPGSLPIRPRHTSHTCLQLTYFRHECKCCIASVYKRRPPWWGGLCELCALTFLFDVCWKRKGCAIKRTQAQPGHVGDCRKAFLTERMSVALYQGRDVADQEKLDGECV